MLKKNLEEKKKTSVGDSLVQRVQSFAHGKATSSSSRGSQLGVALDCLLQTSAPAKSAMPGEIFRHTAGGASRLKSPAEIALEDSGRPYAVAFEEVGKLIGTLLGIAPEGDGAAQAPPVVTYLQVTSHGHVPERSLGRRQTRELHTAGSRSDGGRRRLLAALGRIADAAVQEAGAGSTRG